MGVNPIFIRVLPWLS